MIVQVFYKVYNVIVFLQDPPRVLKDLLANVSGTSTLERFFIKKKKTKGYPHDCKDQKGIFGNTHNIVRVCVCSCE